MASLEWVRNAFGVGTWAEPTGTGGGSADVTDGITTAVAPTSIRFPAGTVSESGGVATVVVTKLLKSELITYQTVGLAGPNGPDVAVRPFTVANGLLAVGDVILDVWLDVIEFFDGPGNALTHVVALDGSNFQDLYATRPDLAFDYFEDLDVGNISSFGMADNVSGIASRLLDVRTNNAGGLANSDAFVRVLPSEVLTSDFGLGIFIAENPWGQTQGQMYLNALVATPAT